MKASDFKKLVQVLSLFASARESAQEPESRIGVQVSKGVAKLIAGKGPTGVVITLDGETTGKFAYTVDARPFLQAAKVITGKQEVTIDVAEQGVTIKTSEGGMIFLKVEGRILETGYPKKPKYFLVSSRVNADQFGQLAKVFDAIHEDYEIEAPTLQHLEGSSHFVCVTPIKEKRALYAHLQVDGEMLEPEIKDYAAAGYPAFWRSLKHFDADGIIHWGEDGLLAVSGPYELYAEPYRVSPYNRQTRKSEPPRNPEPWPIMALSGEPSVQFTVDKKVLVEAVKGVMPNDEHGRVTIEVRDGLINIAAFGTEGGMTVPAQTVHRGHRACDSALLLKIIRAMDGKTITIGWAQQPAIILSAPEMVGWTILLAPVALSAGD